MNAETSDRIASIAGRLVQITAADIVRAKNSGPSACESIADEIRSLAASALRQHEQDDKGTVAPSTFYDRLLGERADLAARTAKLAEFIGYNRATVSTTFAKLDDRQKLYLRAQHNFMSAYLMTLDLRMADISAPEPHASEIDKDETRAAVEQIDENVRITGGGKSEEPLPFKE